MWIQKTVSLIILFYRYWHYFFLFLLLQEVMEVRWGIYRDLVYMEVGFIAKALDVMFLPYSLIGYKDSYRGTNIFTRRWFTLDNKSQCSLYLLNFNCKFWNCAHHHSKSKYICSVAMSIYLFILLALEIMCDGVQFVLN